MQGTLRPVPDFRAASSRYLLLQRPSRAAPVAHRAQSLQASALARPSWILDSFGRRVRARPSQWRAAVGAHRNVLLPPSTWMGREVGGLGQIRMWHDESLGLKDYGQSVGAHIKDTLKNAVDENQLVDGASCRAVFSIMRKKHGKDGIWACFQYIQSKGQLSLLVDDNSGIICDEILRSALGIESRLEILVGVAQSLLPEENFNWPDLYMKIIHFFLECASYEAVLRWHMRLSPIFPPQKDVFGALLASFVTNPTPKMQSILTSLYVSGVERTLYDDLIPALFASGQSQLARTWRKKLILFQDYPSTSRSQQFLRFLVSYYPSVRLSDPELAVIGLDHQEAPAFPVNDEGEVDDNPELPRSLQSDSIVAKWFASTWTSLEFAINLAHRLGVHVVGPRSLQALALREQDARDVAARINQLEKLDIEISPQVYCKVLIAFANNGEDELLSDLLNCDIHPDEFEDIETRQMFLAEATRQGDWKRELLFQGIEWVIETGPTSRRLNSLLRSEVSKRKPVRARALLDRMGALNVNMTQTSAVGLLKKAFWRLGHHPYDRISRTDPRDPILDRAIDIARRIAHHDVAIPLQYWKVILYNLGRSRRLSQLEQLSLELVRLYSPPYGGLIPVHREDFPGSLDVDEKEYIPADLPFAHHDHPLRRIFDHRLQRSIVRWAFDQTLATDPDLPAFLNIKSHVSFAEYDVARGVRLLAQLRDRGVLIDVQVLRSGVLSRVVLGDVPGRLRSRARDSNELSVRYLKGLVEEAWGSEVFPSLECMTRELKAQRPKLWKRYPRLFDKAYG